MAHMKQRKQKKRNKWSQREQEVVKINENDQIKSNIRCKWAQNKVEA